LVSILVNQTNKKEKSYYSITADKKPNLSLLLKVKIDRVSNIEEQQRSVSKRQSVTVSKTQRTQQSVVADPLD
jgi:DNA-binding PadR family transcriptional regulator